MNYYYQGRNLESDNLSSEVRPTGLTAPAGFEHIHDAGGLLGGPLKRNRAWFFGNYRYMDAAETRSDFAEPLTTEDTMSFIKGTVQVTAQHKAELSYYYRDFVNFPYTAVASFRNSGDPRFWMGVGKSGSRSISCRAATRSCSAAHPESRSFQRVDARGRNNARLCRAEQHDIGSAGCVRSVRDTGKDWSRPEHFSTIFACSATSFPLVATT